MGKNQNEKNNTLLYVIIVFIIIALLGVGAYFVLNHETANTNGGISSKSIREETLTAENYEEMMDKIEKEMKEDEELYYLGYSITYYMVQDGLASALKGNSDESAMYVNIYGKTVKQLIDEGKQLMKDNDMTIEKFKQEIENMNNTVYLNQ